VRSCLALALALALVVPAAGASAQAQPRPFQAPAAGDLFVLTAASGTLESVPGRSRAFELVLRRPARDVTMFTDRPARRAGEQRLGRFVARWGGLGFGEVPPNAALVLADAPSDRDVLVVELSRPRLGAGGRTLAFRATALRGSPRGLLREYAKKADRRVADRFGRVSLYIDPSGQEVGLRFTLSNVPSTDLVTIFFTNGQVDTTTDAALPTSATTDAAASFLVGANSFVLSGVESSAVNAQVQIGLGVVAAAKSVTGTATLPAGTTATVTVASTSKTFPVTNGRLSIPLS
jgi:hypothetical protein